MNMSPKFKPGDKVTFTNDQGCVYKGKTVLSLDAFWTDRGHRYFIDPTDSPWFSVHERNLKMSNE